MDMVNDKEKKDSPATDKDHLSNCWKLPPRLVYSKFSSSGSETQPLTLSGNTNSISSFGDPVTQPADYAIIQHANKQLTELNKAVKDQKAEWEKEAKVRAKERDDAEREISSALEKLQNTANQSNSQGSVISNEIQQLFEKTNEMEKSDTKMAKWCTTFDAKQKKRFKEQDKKMTKAFDAQTLNFDNKMDALATSVQEQLTTNQSSLQQMMQEQRDHLDAKVIVLLGSLQNMRATTEKSCNKIIAIQNQFDANSDGPHNKCQKHSSMDADPVD
eukprot:7316031-Ditylum_brightwellii.AAC.1